MNKKLLVLGAVAVVSIAGSLVYFYWPDSILPAAIVVGCGLAIKAIF